MESPAVVNFGVIKLESPHCFLCAYQSQSQMFMSFKKNFFFFFSFCEYFLKRKEYIE